MSLTPRELEVLRSNRKRRLQKLRNFRKHWDDRGEEKHFTCTEAWAKYRQWMLAGEFWLVGEDMARRLRPHWQYK